VNSLNVDPDVQHMPLMAYNPIYLNKKIFSPFFNRELPTDYAHILCKYQHYLFYPIMSFARFNLYFQGFAHAFGFGMYKGKEKLWNRSLQQLTLVMFWIWFPLLVMQCPTLKARIIFVLASHMTAGLLHVQILLSHSYMPTYEGITYSAGDGNDDAIFIKTQLNHSLDIECHPWMDWFHGGLQFQVEHHVWPRVSRQKLRSLRTILKEFAKEHNLNHSEDPFIPANMKLLSHLYDVSKKTNSWSQIISDGLNLDG